MEIDLRVPKDVLTFGSNVPESLAATSIASIDFRNLYEHKKSGMTSNQINTTTPKEQVLGWIHKSLSNGIRSGKADKPREWLKKRGLSIELTGACFNSGQLHHRKPQGFKDALEHVGFMMRSEVPTNNGQIPYTIFGHYSIIFPLYNKEGDVVNFYCLPIRRGAQKYMNEEGIYPRYPSPLTRKLYITSTILDAAAILESESLDNREAVIALHDGEVMPQHMELVESLSHLEEIVFVKTKNIRL